MLLNEMDIGCSIVKPARKASTQHDNWSAKHLCLSSVNKNMESNGSANLFENWRGNNIKTGRAAISLVGLMFAELSPLSEALAEKTWHGKKCR